MSDPRHRPAEAVTAPEPSRRAAGRTGSRTGLWLAFAAVHGWLAWVGIVWMPQRAFYDVDLYRYWAAVALDAGRWPVLDEPWVYPAGALVPVLTPALTGARSTAGYAVGWAALVTLLDLLAVVVLLRAARRADRARGSAAGVWWWLAFLALLGPVAMGRLDAVVAPLTVVALVLASRHPGTAAALLTAGAWIKVAPGAVLLPLVAVARRPVRTVVVPAAAVCAVVVGAVAAGGGLARLTGFLTEQGRRGLQVEAVASTPWVLAAQVDDSVRIAFDEDLVTWEVTGPGTATAARVLGVVLPLTVAALGAVLLRTGAPRPRAPHLEVPGAPGQRPPEQRPHVSDADVLLWGALAASTLLIVANKVGSPQFVGWLAAPVAVALTVAPDPRPWHRVAGGVLGIAALTQVVFPVGADGVVTGDPFFTVVLVLRNVALVVLLAAAVRRLVVRRHPDRAEVSPAGS